ncbi:hypothetical protein KKH81_01360 [Patescibacteria group bacterium]|nr:hypothetical protein [Patescibacteria group bacterium]
MNELIIDDKVYVSSKRAAEITGYAKDYVGQLCREGRVQARLVGRSWYVLEDSIKAHRFGEEEVESPESDLEDGPVVVEAPRYVVEEVPSMPQMVEREDVATVEHEAEVKSEALSDMQEAWQEWFEQKQEEILDVKEEVIEELERQEVEKTPEEVSINTPWSQIQSNVPIQRSHTSMPSVDSVQRMDIARVEHVQPVVRRTRPVQKKGTSVLVQLVLLLIVTVLVTVTAVGTGYADNYLGKEIRESTVFQYLGGKSVLNK